MSEYAPDVPDERPRQIFASAKRRRRGTGRVRLVLLWITALAVVAAVVVSVLSA